MQRDALKRIGMMAEEDMLNGPEKESILGGAARETMEEAGIALRVIDFVGRVNDFYGDPEGILVNLGVYVHDGNTEINPQNDELTDFIFVPVSVLLTDAKDPAIELQNYLKQLNPSAVISNGARKNGIREISGLFKQVFMADKAETGGIDLNPDKINYETTISDRGLKFNLDPALLEHARNASGVSPVIISISSLDSLSAFMDIQ